MSSLVLVGVTLTASLLAIVASAGLLRQAGAPTTLGRAAVVFLGVSLAIGQPPAAAGLARRMRGSLSDSRIVSAGLLLSSILLLAVAVAMSRLL